MEAAWGKADAEDCSEQDQGNSRSDRVGVFIGGAYLCCADVTPVGAEDRKEYSEGCVMYWSEWFLLRVRSVRSV